MKVAEEEGLPVGVPEMTPVALLKVKPAGREGDTEYETALPVASVGVLLVMGWPKTKETGVARVG